MPSNNAPTITVSTTSPADVAADILIIPVYDSMELPSSLPGAMRSYIKEAANQASYKGQWGKAELFVAPKSFNFSFVALAGIGSAAAPVSRQMEGVRRSLGSIANDARKHMLRKLAVAVPQEESGPMAKAAVEAVLLSDYRFTEHKASLRKEQKNKSVKTLILLARASDAKAVQKTVLQAQRVMAGVSLTRDLVNQPASHMSPAALVKQARSIAKDSPQVTVTIMNRKQAEQKKFAAFLAVARGSKEEPYVIHLKYKPLRQAHRRQDQGKAKKKTKKKIVLVGKGITFDSGGLSLKPAQPMENMKIDMGGAATVLGVFSVLGSVLPDVEVHGIVAACENMPSSTAYRPGDILRARNGKTIEVLNTDAEGRITLADALSYAADLKPDAIIDLATLTGACVVAVGDTYAGLWSNNDDLQSSILEAAGAASEGVVPFPLPQEYRPTIESKIADVRNIATMNTGGAITAALFLREFVGETPWAHMDVAGPVYAERPLISYYAHGATGYGVRTLIEFLQKA